MPAVVNSSISAKSACGSITTPLPMTHVTPGCRMPDGIRRSTNFVPFTYTVWPALWPPWYRATIEKFGVSRSTILPLPSSPHCAPSTTRFISGVRFYPEMIVLDGSSLTIEQLVAIADHGEQVALSAAARGRVRASRAVVDARARGDEPAYGINTGFGSFADVKIAPDALNLLQLNLLRSHAAGLGRSLPRRTVRATMALRANVLAKGFSGIRVETLEAFIELLNRGVHPYVPS